MLVDLSNALLWQGTSSRAYYLQAFVGTCVHPMGRHRYRLAVCLAIYLESWCLVAVPPEDRPGEQPIHLTRRAWKEYGSLLVVFSSTLQKGVAESAVIGCGLEKTGIGHTDTVYRLAGGNLNQRTPYSHWVRAAQVEQPSADDASMTGLLQFVGTMVIMRTRRPVCLAVANGELCLVAVTGSGSILLTAKVEPINIYAVRAVLSVGLSLEARGSLVEGCSMVGEQQQGSCGSGWVLALTSPLQRVGNE